LEAIGEFSPVSFDIQRTENENNGRCGKSFSVRADRLRAGPTGDALMSVASGGSDGGDSSDSGLSYGIALPAPSFDSTSSGRNPMRRFGPAVWTSKATRAVV